MEEYMYYIIMIAFMVIISVGGIFICLSEYKQDGILVGTACVLMLIGVLILNSVVATTMIDRDFPETDTHIIILSEVNNDNIRTETNDIFYLRNIKNFDWKIGATYEITIGKHKNYQQSVVDIRKIEE